MELATILSIVALAVAAASAFFTYVQASATRAQARAASDQLRIIREQWHDMQRPKIRAWHHLAEDGSDAITFINDGPRDVANGVLEIGTVGHQLVESIGGRRRIERFAWPVGSGESYVIRRARPDAGHATFRLTTPGPDGRDWSVAIECEIPAAQGNRAS
jgi:type II secretory pathway pseudopilin PulG